MAAAPTPADIAKLKAQLDQQQKQIEQLLTKEQITALRSESIGMNGLNRLLYDRGLRDKVGVTDQQKADFRRLSEEEIDHLRRIDRQAIKQVMKLLTPPQKEKLRAKMVRLGR